MGGLRLSFKLGAAIAQRSAGTFAPWHVAPFVTPRAAAIHWAENERKAIRA